MSQASCVLSLVAVGNVLALCAVATLPSCGKAPAQVQLTDGGPFDGSGNDGDGTSGGGGNTLDAAQEPDVLHPGDYPVWEPLAEMLLDCQIELVSNAPAVRPFTFTACETTPDCERMVYAQWLSDDPNVLKGVTLPNFQLRETTVGSVAAFEFGLPGADMVLFIREDGQLVAGYRTSHGPNKCSLPSAAAGGGHYGAVLTSQPPQKPIRVGGVLGTFTNPASPSLFEVAPAPPGYGPFPTVMGDNRWLWGYYPPLYVTLSVVDGSDPATFVKYSDPAPGSILDLTFWPASTGPTFLFQQVSTPDGVVVESQLAVSDGIQPPKAYLIPPPDTWDDKPGYAHTHLGWFRGIHQTSPGVYDKLEVWASPYTADPAMLAPYKVDDYALKTPPLWIAAGHGWFAAHSGQDPPVYGELYAWNLATKARKAFTLPGARRIMGMIGISPTHVWVAGASGDPAPTDMVARFRLIP